MLRDGSRSCRISSRADGSSFHGDKCVPLDNGEIFVTFDKSVGVIRNGRYRELEGLARPCRVLRSACAIDGNGEIYFGEYLANNERGPMRVYNTARVQTSSCSLFLPGRSDKTHPRNLFRSRDKFADLSYGR